MKILIADDSKFMRIKLRQVCERTKPEEVEEAANGLEALQKCETFKPDLVFMDVTMPQMNGVEATERIKAKYPQIKVVICSAIAGTKMVQEMLEKGADEIIAKPFSDDKVLEVIDMVTRQLQQ